MTSSTEVVIILSPCKLDNWTSSEFPLGQITDLIDRQVAAIVRRLSGADEGRQTGRDDLKSTADVPAAQGRNFDSKVPKVVGLPCAGTDRTGISTGPTENYRFW